MSEEEARSTTAGTRRAACALPPRADRTRQGARLDRALLHHTALSTHLSPVVNASASMGITKSPLSTKERRGRWRRRRTLLTLWSLMVTIALAAERCTVLGRDVLGEFWVLRG